MWRIRAQPRATGAPAKMVQFVAGLRHVHAADDLAVRRGPGGNVRHADRVRAPAAGRGQGDEVSWLPGRTRHRGARRWIKGRMGLPPRHAHSPYTLRLPLPSYLHRVARGALPERPTPSRAPVACSPLTDATTSRRVVGACRRGRTGG